MFINETQDVAKKYTAAARGEDAGEPSSRRAQGAQGEGRERGGAGCGTGGAGASRDGRRREARGSAQGGCDDDGARRREGRGGAGGGRPERTGDEATNHGGREDGGGEAQSTGAYPNVILAEKKPHVEGLWIYVHAHGGYVLCIFLGFVVVWKAARNASRELTQQSNTRRYDKQRDLHRGGYHTHN